MKSEPDPVVLGLILIGMLIVGLWILSGVFTVIGAIFEVLGEILGCIFEWLFSESEESKKQAAAQAAAIAEQQAQVALLQAQIAWDAHQIDMSLPCPKCELLAPPIPGTGTRYRCAACSHQFAGPEHNVFGRPG